MRSSPGQNINLSDWRNIIFKRRYEAPYYNGLLTREAPDSQRNQNRLKTLLITKQSGRLLEIGCGKGGFLRQAEKFFDIEGMDISSYAVSQIKPHFGDRVIACNIEQQQLPFEKYHTVAAFNVLEHLRQPEIVTEKIFHSLARGGVLFGSVPNNFGLVGGIATRLSNFFDRTHISTFPPAAWEEIFRRAGFSQVHFFGELTFGPNTCWYLYGRSWRYLSFNLMFLCEK